jgi:hypothetical protein
MLSRLAMDGCTHKLLLKKGVNHGRGVQAEAAGGACGVPADFASDNTMIHTRARCDRHLRKVVEDACSSDHLHL